MEQISISLIVLLFILLILAAFFAGSETALTSMSRIRIKHLIEEGDKRKEMLKILLEQPVKYLSTLLFTTLLVHILASTTAAIVAENIFKQMGMKSYQSIGVGVATGVMTFLILVFGEITPKTYAVQNAEKFTLRVIRIVHFLSIFLYPIVQFLNMLSIPMIKLLGGEAREGGPFLSEEELKMMVSVGEKEGVIEEEEKEMIHSIFEFGDTLVKEVMTPRPDMTCVSDEMKLHQILEVIKTGGHSRIPVCKGTEDNIIGIINAKDLLDYLNKSEFSKPIKTILREPYFIPETKKVSELLGEMRNTKIHMAVVVDEYGDTAGLVTIEDLLEEIVGDIFDEYDVTETLIEKIDKDTISVNGRVNIDEINKYLGVDLSNEDYETAAGLVLAIAGKVPKQGEEFEHDNLKIKVLKVRGNRIQKVLIKKVKTVEADES